MIKNKNKNILMTILFVVVSTIILTVIVLKHTVIPSYNRKSIAISSTVLNITIKTPNSKFENLISSITNEIMRIDNVLNPYNDKSEIANVNLLSLSGEQSIELSDELAMLFAVGFKYSEMSDYHFDISIRPLIELWSLHGFSDSAEVDRAVPTESDISLVLSQIGSRYASIETNTGKNYLNLTKPLTFDLGAYGKGYILKSMVSILEKNNIKDFLIDYGGDTFSRGLNPSGVAWTIGISAPRDDIGMKFIGVLEATNMSVVTSGDYERFFIENGKRYHHIIDARTGYPEYNAISATIVTEDPMIADALSTVAFVLGTNFFTNEMFDYKEVYLVTEDIDGEIGMFIKTNRF